MRPWVEEPIFDNRRPVTKMRTANSSSAHPPKRGNHGAGATRAIKRRRFATGIAARKISDNRNHRECVHRTTTKEMARNTRQVPKQIVWARALVTPNGLNQDEYGYKIAPYNKM